MLASGDEPAERSVASDSDDSALFRFGIRDQSWIFHARIRNGEEVDRKYRD